MSPQGSRKAHLSLDRAGPLSGDLADAISLTLRARGTSSDRLNLKGTLRPVPLRFSASMDAADLPLEWLGPPLRASKPLSPSGRLSANLDTTITEEKEETSRLTQDRHRA